MFTSNAVLMLTVSATVAFSAVLVVGACVMVAVASWFVLVVKST